MSRNETIKSLRPNINTIKFELVTSKEEEFQNVVLRPIIKYQHELLLSIFEYHKTNKKVSFDGLVDEKIKLIIKNIFSKDRNLINDLRGVVIGLFTVEEFQLYLSFRSGVNKRIVQMIEERVLSVYCH